MMCSRSVLCAPFSSLLGKPRQPKTHTPLACEAAKVVRGKVHAKHKAFGSRRAVEEPRPTHMNYFYAPTAAALDDGFANTWNALLLV